MSTRRHDGKSKRFTDDLEKNHNQINIDYSVLIAASKFKLKDTGSVLNVWQFNTDS